MQEVSDGHDARLDGPLAGPAVFGLFAGHTGYPAAFALTGVLMVAALPAAWPEHSHAASAGYRASTT